jgi:hypothetical protein
MRVCIVGASGKLGQYMVQHALDRDYDVVGVCREQSVEKLDAFKGRITLVPGATDDPEVIERAVAGCDGVLAVLRRRLPPRNRSDFPDYVEGFRLPKDLEISDLALLALTTAKLPSDGFSIVDPLDPAIEQCDLVLEIAGFRYHAPENERIEPGARHRPVTLSSLSPAAARHSSQPQKRCAHRCA